MRYWHSHLVVNQITIQLYNYNYNNRYNCNPLQEASLYDAGHKIEYLDWVIQESLRVYPPGAM